MSRISLKSKTALAAAALVVALVGAMALFTRAYFTRQGRQAFAEQQAVLVSELAAHLDDTLRAARLWLLAEARELPANALSDPARARDFLEARLPLQPYFDRGLYLFTNDGAVLAATHPLPGGTHLAEVVRRTARSNRPQAADPHLLESATPLTLFTVPLTSAGGRPLAVAAGGIDLQGDNFLTQALTAGVGRKGELSLVNGARTLLVPAAAGRDAPPGTDPLFDRAMAGFEGTGETVDAGGRGALATFKRLATVDWIVAARSPHEVVYGPIREGVRYLLAVAAAASALSLPVLWLLMRHLTAPLRQLTAHIHALSGAACGHRPFVTRSRDEAGELATAFNGLMERLCSQEVRLRQLSGAVEQSPMLTVITDREGRMVYVNPAFTAITGYAPDEALGRKTSLLKSGAQAEEVYRELWETILAGKSWQGEFHNRKKDGSCYWASAVIAPIFDEAGRISHFLGEQEDITARRRVEEALRESEERLRAIVETAVDAIIIIDERGTVESANPATEGLFGYPPAELAGRNVSLLMPEPHASRHDGYIADYLRTGQARIIGIGREVEGRRKDGRPVPVSLAVSEIRLAERRLFAGIIHDLTLRKEYEARLEKMARFDALTGLPNRHLLADRMDQGLAHAQRHGELAAVFFLDIDHFKQINDTYGHDAGDELLKGFAGRLLECVRKSDTVARLGGDEFVVVVTDLVDRGGAMRSATKIIESMQPPFDLAGQPVPVATSIGIALYPGDGDDGETLLKRADQALYAAKQAGRNRYAFYQPSSPGGDAPPQTL